MGRAKNFVFGLIVALAAVSGAAPRWAESVDFRGEANPGKFHDKTVTAKALSQPRSASAGDIQGLPCQDGTAEMLVISDDSRIPSKNARVRVRGESGSRPVRGSLVRPALARKVD